MRQGYYLFKRKNSPYYQVKIGEKKISISTLHRKLGADWERLKPTSKAVAQKIVQEYIARFGGLNIYTDTIKDYLRSFWTNESDYVRQKRARGSRISDAYLEDNNKLVKRFTEYLENYFPGLSISDLSPHIINSYLLKQKESGISGRRCNAILQAISVPLTAYYKGLGILDRNPAKLIQKFPEDKKERRLWTPGEVRLLFKDPAIWRNERVYMANMLAAVSGMRRGEISGLLIDDLGPDYINVRHNWQSGKIVSPKWGSERMVPIPEEIITRLFSIYSQNPWGNQFVFWGGRRHLPLSGHEMLCSLKEAMERIGITSQAAAARGLSFHAWRHWYNTMLRGRLKDYELRSLTGHSSEKMTNHYTHTEITTDIRKAVNELADIIN